MRVGIDYRILAVGNELVNRGMGRYTQQQLRAILDVDQDNEYVLLCNTDADLSLIHPGIRSSQNVAVRLFSGGTYSVSPDPSMTLRRAEEYQDWIYRQGIDVYHATTPFLLHEPVLASFDAAAMVATFYDVIPLVYPSRYLENWPAKPEYLRSLDFVKGSDRIVAISNAARADATSYLGIPPDRIDVAWPIADDCFLPLPPPAVREGLATLRARVRLPECFILTVTHLHHAKNPLLVLRAFALLPPAVRAQLPLVMCCHFDGNEAVHVRALADELGIADDLVLTGLVTNEELAALYNAATLVVHPSRYEGFGLPVLEAMQSGAPVITTTSSSLPEVAGDAAVLVDPEAPDELAAAVLELYGDEERRLLMAARGLERARLFDASQLADRTLGAYRKAIRTAQSRGADGRPHIAVWTPLPPQRSGVAEYSAELLQSLQGSCDVEVFVDDGALPPRDVLVRHPVHHFLAFDRRQGQRPFDVVIYQLAGNLLHLYVYEAIQRHPGVVVLHDLTLSHLLYTNYLKRGRFEEFKRQLAAIEGGGAVAELTIARQGKGPALERAMSDFLFDHPMLKGVIDHSTVQVVHYDAARQELERRYPDARVETVTMGVADPYRTAPDQTRPATRQRVGAGDTTFVIGVFGVVHPFKRLECCLVAFGELLSSHPDSLLVIVGEMFDPSYQERLTELAAKLGALEHVRFVGFAPRSQFDSLLIACDAVVNLRFPFMKQMSATLVRALAAGKPVIITDILDWPVPEDACLRVPPGDAEQPTLTAHLRRLASDEHLRARLSAAARTYFETEATIDRMAARYLDVIRRASQPDQHLLAT